jgi:hypothetical protein
MFQMKHEDIKNMHIAVYALSLLGGAHQKVHTENIAQKCFEIAPDRFKWEHFPYPEKELVRKALFHASEENNGSLVTGRTGIEQRGKLRDGWQLTPAGAAWVRENEPRLGDSLGPKSTSIPRREAERFLKKIRAEVAYKVFSATGSLDEVSPYMFTDLLNCSPDAPADTIRSKLDRLLSVAELVNERDVLSFLKACEGHFANLLHGRGISPEDCEGGMK